ncbi:hypothetical protein HGH93_21250 [Chitinophaga polysaccharea]|nr:hypothetical protein [Chitinophaga polysaccharea]NLR60650.1 hypothetical protein [Chitinophaga polysaccharea]
MTYTRVKSEIPAWVSLLEKAKEIIQEYGLEAGASYRETVFHYVSNKVLNDNLKVIGLICGFSVELPDIHSAPPNCLLSGLPLEQDDQPIPSHLNQVETTLPDFDRSA